MKRGSWLLVGLALVLHGACLAQPKTRPGDNVALGKTVRLTPRTNYKHCTDPDDKVQLTDGVYSQGYFWTQKSTVGWSRANPATITIDLGGIEPICGMSYNTAAGVAGVTWPMSLLVLVSNDGKTYHLVGDLVELDLEHGKPKADGYGVHCYWTDKLATHGRFVRLLIVPSGPYTFVDEIEVFRGRDGLVDEPLTGREVTDIKQFFAEICVSKGIRRRLRSDVETVRGTLDGVEGRAALEKELVAIEMEAGKLKVEPRPDFKTIFPMNDLHRRIFAVQAAAWRAKGVKPITAWPKAKWDMVSPFEQPQGSAAVDVQMMSNEFRSGAFLLSNAGDAAADLRLSITGLPGGANPGYVTVHEGVFTDTKKGVPVVAALPLARREGDGYVFKLDPGTTKQVWLTFNPKDVPAGEHTGTVAIQPGGIEVPVRLKIYPFRFPDQPTLHLGGWDYTNVDKMYNITPENRTAVIQHLREHFVDTPWATRGVMPYGKYDDAGNMIEEPDPTNFETWIKRWPGARNYYVFAALRSKFAQFEMGTPPFKKAVASWIAWWVKKLREWNIRPEQLGLLLVDEPSNEEKSLTIIEYAKVIQEAQPRVIVWEDVTWREPWKAPPELFTLSDTLCPNLPMWIDKGKPFADFYEKQRDAGRTLWFYSCSGPGKLLDPYSYHRMQQWFLWRYKGKGSCFWAFGDSNGASSWNEYLARRGAYTPMFLDDTSVTPGKHMEAIREGMEDYEYLRILRDRVAELEKAGKKGEAIDAAKKLLATAADRVTACMTEQDKINWEEPKDRSIADAVRVEVLEMLVKLKGM
ncbi:MAG: hypothetical protein GXP25_13410 [Planctomycetes bacterium]|nr:hypothetical protein [Planctomycetota bacterium]